MVLLDHVGVKVTDLERAVAFYTELFELPIAERRRFANGIDAVGLKVGETVMFLLYHPDHRLHDPDDVKGVDHFCLTFDGEQWDKIIATIRERRLRTPDGDVMDRGGATGFSPSIYVADPDGNKVEVKRRS